MSDDAQDTIARVREALRTDPYWKHHRSLKPGTVAKPPAVHLAIFVEPYLTLLLQGTKTVESRFAMKRIAPYERAQAGDVLLLKRSSGPIVGICEVAEAVFYRLDSAAWADIARRFRADLALVGDDFDALRNSDVAYASMLRVAHVRPLPPISFVKRDRRGWVILGAPSITPVFR